MKKRNLFANRVSALLKLAILVIAVTTCFHSIADEDLRVVDVLETHDVYTYYPSSSVDEVAAIRGILPIEVTAVLNDGSRIYLDVAESWRVRGDYYINHVAETSLPAGVSDEQGLLDNITVQSRPYTFVHSSLTLSGNELRVETYATASVFQLYKAGSNGMQLVADSRSSSISFSRTADYGAFEETGATPASFNQYMGAYYEPGIRTGRNPAPIYVAFPGQVENQAEPSQIAHAAAPAKVKPAKVKLKSVKKYDKRATIIRWAGTKNAACYEVYVKTDGGKYKKLTTTRKTKCFQTNLKKGRKYTYKVRAVSADGTKGAWSVQKSKKF